MSAPETLVLAVLVLLGLASLCYALLALSCARRWLDEPARPAAADAAPLPLTLLRPLKVGVPALRAKLDALVEAMQPGDQLVLGVDVSAGEMDVCAALRAAFPEREIIVVSCRAGAVLNPKISKLVQMTPHARHAHWVLSDSESLIDAAWLDAFRREWQASGADVLTAGYRFVNLATWPQRLDAAATLLELWPGLAMLRRFGRVNFTLGACTGFRRADMETVGGWAAFGDFLAEDNRLGAALARAGRTIRLSTQVVTLDSDLLSWRDYWRHQRRVAVTYRVCSPVGFVGLILVNGMVASTLLVVFAAATGTWTGPCVLLAAVVQLVRWRCFRALGKALRFSIPSLFPVMLAAGAVQIACGCVARSFPRVWWAGRRWEVSRAGRLTPRP